MEKKRFGISAFNLEYEIFVIYVGSLNSNPLDTDVHPFYRSQISSLIAEKIPTKVPNKYADFTYVFSLDLAFILLEHTKFND